MAPFDEKGKYVRIPTDLKPKNNQIDLLNLNNKRIYFTLLVAITVIFVFISKL